MSIKYKRDIQMKFDATWLFLSENVAYSLLFVIGLFFTPIYQFFQKS